MEGFISGASSLHYNGTIAIRVERLPFGKRAVMRLSWLRG